VCAVCARCNKLYLWAVALLAERCSEERSKLILSSSLQRGSAAFVIYIYTQQCTWALYTQCSTILATTAMLRQGGVYVPGLLCSVSITCVCCSLLAQVCVRTACTTLSSSLSKLCTRMLHTIAHCSTLLLQTYAATSYSPSSAAASAAVTVSGSTLSNTELSVSVK
jgi:hypothetical protein